MGVAHTEVPTPPTPEPPHIPPTPAGVRAVSNVRSSWSPGMSPCPMVLVFGCRQSKIDHIYREEALQAKNKGVFRELYTAYSREPDKPKVTPAPRVRGVLPGGRVPTPGPASTLLWAVVALCARKQREAELGNP